MVKTEWALDDSIFILVHEICLFIAPLDSTSRASFEFVHDSSDRYST